MATYRLKWNEEAPAPCRGALLTIGNFDGVHRGHASLLARLRTVADQRGVPAVALTFDPHPLFLLRPDHYQPAMTTLDQRAALLAAQGADQVAILGTEPGLLQLSAQEFFDRVLVQGFAARGLVEGPTFGFGRNREGNVEVLARYCAKAGISFAVAEPLTMDGGIVSSSRVRKALLAGHVEAAARWLGRPYRLAGVVGTGQRRGAGLGFPTANLEKVETVIPGDGVYAGRAWIGDRDYPAAVNIGPNPTFAEQGRKIEAHLVGFKGNLYGRPLALDITARLRDTRRFASVEELLGQIQEDIAQVQEIRRRDAEER